MAHAQVAVKSGMRAFADVWDRPLPLSGRAAAPYLSCGWLPITDFSRWDKFYAAKRATTKILETVGCFHVCGGGASKSSSDQQEASPWVETGGGSVLPSSYTNPSLV
jgi:hypothetical protein